MLHGYKKSKYNIYDNLEFLGLNPYEQKHFCFGEEGSDDPGGDYDADIDRAVAEAEVDARTQDAMAQLADQLNLNQEEFMSARSAAEKAEGLQDLMDMGIYGYNEAVERGFVDAIEQAQRESDYNLAKSIADKYGLEFNQVQPGFMQDPTLGPQTYSYRGPGAFTAQMTEIGKAIAGLGFNIVDMFPSPANIAFTVAKEEGLIDVPSLGLKEGVMNAFDEMAASQREANMAARGETVAAPETLSEQVAAAPEAYDPAIGMADPAFEGRAGVSYTESPFSGLPAESVESYMNAMTALQEAEAASPSQPQSSVDYFDALIDTTPTPSPAKDFYGDILDGDEIIPRIIAKTPTTTPVVKEVDIAAATPRTRTAATDTFSILANIYGPEVAEKLLPTRIV